MLERPFLLLEYEKLHQVMLAEAQQSQILLSAAVLDAAVNRQIFAGVEPPPFVGLAGARDRRGDGESLPCTWRNTRSWEASGVS